MITRIVEQTLRIALLLLIAVHVLLLTTVAIEKAALAKARHHYDGHVSAVPDPHPAGFTAAGAAVDFANTGSGFALRFASHRCPFSRGDAQWKVLSDALQARGIPMSVLVPGVEHAFPPSSLVPSGVQQIAYIDADWIKNYRLYVTPTLLILDSDRRVIWHREGSLSRADVTSALRAIDTSRMRR
jgi:hypothetical protein